MQKFKDIGLDITEQEYRDLDNVSYSLLSALDREGPTSVGKQQGMTDSMLFGSIVDKMIDNSFKVSDYHVSNGVIIGGGLQLAVNAVIEHLELMEIPVNADISLHKQDIIDTLNGNSIDYYAKKDSEWVADKIIKELPAIEFFKDYVAAKGKEFLSPQMLDACTETYNVLKTHEFTKDIFQDFDEESGIEGIYQFKYAFPFESEDIKVMLDRIIVNHNLKTIQPIDLKTGGKSSLEFETSFFYWRYDIQGVLYRSAILKVANEYYPDYKVLPFKFVYIGRFENKPLIWTMDSKMEYAALKGYNRNNRNYKGVYDLLNDYNWYKANSFAVDYPESVYLSNGHLHIDMTGIIINS